MAKWTFEQRAAIELRQANLLISAAAGSGKTAVLVERITQLIQRREAEIHKMLIVTYTNAAAGEMRGRIEASLAQAIDVSAENSGYLNEQIKLLNRASIKTFHAFCLDILRSHFQKIDCDPGFKMLGEPERTILVRKTIEEVVEQFYEAADPSFLAFVDSYSGNKNDEKLIEMVLQLFHFIQSQPHPELWLVEVQNVYADSEHPIRHRWHELIRTHFVEQLKSGIELLEHAIMLCEQSGGPAVYIPTFEADIKGFEAMIEASTSLEKMAEVVNRFSFNRIASMKKGDKESYDPEIILEVKDTIRDKMIKKQVFEGIKKFFSYKSIERYEAEIQIISSRVEMLCQLTNRFSEQFLAAKKKKNVMDFNDLEHYAIKILEDETVANSLKEKVTYIFVDEYQDASGIQEHIIQKICRSNNLFMVGDVKQSIYKFRLADPELFIKKYKTFTKLDALILEDDRASDELEQLSSINRRLAESSEPFSVRIDLKKNFRTRAEILESVNTIFRSIMSEKLGEIDYDEDAMLYPGMAFEPAKNPYLEVNILSKSALTDGSLNENEADNGIEGEWIEDEVEEIFKTEELEARAISNAIKSRIGTPVYHPKIQAYRPCQYKDIVILLRSSRSWTPTFEQIFLEEGIPLFADSNTGYFDTLEIGMMTALLRIVDNPLQDIPFLTVLRSPMVRLSIEELIRIKTVTQSKMFFYQKCVMYCEQSEKTDALYQKLNKFLVSLNQLREKSHYLPIDEFVWEAIRLNAFDQYVSAMPGGVSRQANLKLLVERAGQLKNSKIATLSHFIEFIDKMSASSGDFGTASVLSEEDDVVRLMSIHKSKGLEFPVVMICGLGRKFNFMDAQGDLMHHKNIGVALAFVDLDLRTKSKTLPQFVIKEQIKKETLSEEMRVLYVGLTRPVDQLVLFATVNDYAAKYRQWSRGIDGISLLHASGYIDWIMPAILGSEQATIRVMDVDQIANQLSEVERVASGNLSHFKGMIQNTESELDAVKAQNDLNTLYQEIDRRMQFKPTVDLAIQKPLKVTVTQLKTQGESDQQIPALIEMPQFMKADASISSVELGTALHTVFEKMDLGIDSTEIAIRQYLESLVVRKFLSVNAIEAIDIKHVQKYIESILVKRMKQAKKVHRETPFVLKYDMQYVQGIIDLYFEELDGLVLVDYKSDKVGKFSMDEIAEKYRLQIELYERALVQLTQKPVKEKYLYFVDTNILYKM